MRIENPMRLVRELKPCELKVYLIVYFAGQPVSNGFIERWTGYSDKPVSAALGYLAEIGLVAKSRQGWVLAEGMQLPLPMEEPTQPSLKGGEEEITAEDNRTEDIGLSRNNSDSLLINTTNNINPIKEDRLVVINPEGRKNSDPLRSALEGCGVAEPKLSRLARLEGYSAADILALDGELRERKGARYGPGLLIHALEHGQRPKKKEESRRYDSGEFAEFIDN